MKGFDCNVKLSFEKALEFKKAGYGFAIRYVGRLKQATIDIDKVEVDNILRAGLKLAIVQHCPPKPGIQATKELGTEYGKNAVLFSNEAGYKTGCIVYLDLEDVTPGTSKQSIIDFCNAWYEQVQVGYTPGVYVGFNTFLTGDELYHKLRFQHYWRSLSKVPDVLKRGYEMVQSACGAVNGIQIDNNIVTGDRLGNSPVFMMPEKILTHVINVYNDGSCEVN